MWLEARDDGTDDPDGEHSAIHQVGGVPLIPDDANGKGKEAGGNNFSDLDETLLMLARDVNSSQENLFPPAA